MSVDYKQLMALYRSMRGSYVSNRDKKKFMDLALKVFPAEVGELRAFYTGTVRDLRDTLVTAMAFVREEDDLGKARVEFFGGLLKSLAKAIQGSFKFHKKFDADRMATFERWSPLVRMLVAKRIQELKDAKVLFRQGKFDLSGVRQTLYGKTVLESLGFEKRYVLTKEEFEKFSAKAKELGFVLPQETAPTKAELYFG